MSQLVTQIVCQVCGRTTQAKAADEHWLNEPHRFVSGIRVVRCPQHWSEWALRNTKAGRTKEMRERARAAAAQPAPAFPPHLDPFPTTNRW